ncbi:MAG: hypothetical protein AVDCRST_MAG68-426, partial [uncultured Gemmatimonadetes bacterium]
ERYAFAATRPDRAFRRPALRQLRRSAVLACAHRGRTPPPRGDSPPDQLWLPSYL